MPRKKKGKGKKTKDEATAEAEKAKSKSAIMNSIRSIVDLITAEVSAPQDLKTELCRKIMEKVPQELEELVKRDIEAHDKIRDVGDHCSGTISQWIKYLEGNITKLRKMTESVESKPEVRCEMNKQEAKTEALKDSWGHECNQMSITQLEAVIKHLKKIKRDACSLQPNKVDIDVEAQVKIIINTMAQRNAIIAHTAPQAFHDTLGMPKSLISKTTEIEKLIQEYAKTIQENLYSEDQKTPAAEKQSAETEVPFSIKESASASAMEPTKKKLPQEHDEIPDEIPDPVRDRDYPKWL